MKLLYSEKLLYSVKAFEVVDMGSIISGIYWLLWVVITVVTIVFGGGNSNQDLIYSENGDPNVVYPESSKYCYVGATGEPIRLINNPNSTDPTYQEMITFLRSDKTDEIEYDPASFMCGDFAETVHNNAEVAGMKAAWVSIDFRGFTAGHACNAFNTTDKGLVFVDCTGIYPSEPGNWDSTVKIEVGEVYQPLKLFTSGETYDQLGVVKNFEIYW